MPEPRELSHGDQVGRYRIVRAIGRGGMGVVYVARDERLGRDVALKMIAGLPDELARTRFWREARVAASVSHPNICQVFEVEDANGSVFLTMELLEGEGLDRRLRQGALPPKDAVPIAVGILMTRFGQFSRYMTDDREDPQYASDVIDHGGGIEEDAIPELTDAKADIGVFANAGDTGIVGAKPP